jgi:hypothetical protein
MTPRTTAKYQWTLEVEDDGHGRSVVWNETFATDHAALDAALGAIEEGTLSFAD